MVSLVLMMMFIMNTMMMIVMYNVKENLRRGRSESR